MTVIYEPTRVCSRKIIVSAEDGIITEAKIIGGCSGNTQGICRLVTGMKIEDAVSRLSGIDCGGKGTSCPDQLSIALRRLLRSGNSSDSVV
ncbi:MAG: TIGR03905 family TSCPD domain-containing protein [Clostridiales bacterium]|nr:TIGR03905 family TSCPD domain-containing protein [Clostridiales bacterium]